MKLSCPRKEFFEAVSATAAASSTRTSLPILQHVKVDATDDGIRVIGCDGEMWAERRVACLVEEAGSICVPARLLVDIIASLPDGDIHLESTDGTSVILTHGASEYRMVSLDPSDFPEPPEFGGESKLTLKMGELRDAVESVIFAVSTDTHRQLLTGVLLNYDGNTLTLVATDTHRLAVRKIDREGIGENLNAVVPEKALKAIKALPISDDAEITILFGAGRLGIDSDHAKVVSQLLTGTYPNWERVVPSESTRSWSLESDQLQSKVKRALIVARDSAQRIRFKGDGDNLVIAARSEEKGEAKEELAMIGESGDVEIAFNGKYVLDAIEPISGPGVRVEMTESMRPAIFRPAEEEKNYFCVIMPMSLT